MINRQEILAELQARGVQVPQQQSAAQPSRQEIMAELQARGVNPQQQTQQQPSLWQSIKGIPADVGAAYKQMTAGPQSAIRAQKEILGGALNTAQGAFNMLAPSSTDMNPALQKMAPYPIQAQNTDYLKKLGITNQQAGDPTLQGAALLAMPELIETKGLGIGARLAAKGAEGAAVGQSQSGSPLLGAAAGVLPGALGSGGKAAAKGIGNIPARLLKGTATPEELAANIAAAGDSRIPLGKITQSPATNKLFENVLAEVPGSGVSGIQQQINENLQSKANDLVSSLDSDATRNVDPNDAQKMALLTARNNSRDIKNNMYNQVDDIAQQEGHQLDLSSFRQKATDSANIIADSPLLQADPKIRAFFNKTMAYKEGATPQESATTSSILQSTGQPFSKTEMTSSPSIKDANLVKNSLWEQGHALTQSSSAVERGIGAKYKELSRAIGDDIKNSINKTGSPELKQSFNDATDYYKNTYGNFLDKEIYKYLNPDKSSDSIAREIIKPSKLNDRHTDIEKIQSLLPAEQQNILPRAYLNNAVDADGKIDPKKLANLTQSLGPRQFNALFKDPELRQKVQDFGRTRQMSEDALNYMNNPKTGARNLAAWSTIAGMAAAGHAIAGPIGAVAGAVGAPLGAKYLAKYLSSPEARISTVQKILELHARKSIAPAQSTLERNLSTQLPRVMTQQQGNQ